MNLIAKALCCVLLFFAILALWTGFGVLIKFFVAPGLSSANCMHVGGLLASLTVIDIFFLIQRKP